MELALIVWTAAAELWADGHYGQAVQRAASFLNVNVQELLGRRDIADSALMAQAFSSNPATADNPRLRWTGNDTDLTVKSMRDGLRGFSSGCFLAIRNPSTHSIEVQSQQDCFEQLASLSLLAKWIDRCDVVTL